VKGFEKSAHDGGLLASYRGRGTLTLDRGSDYGCDFEIEHHAELGVLMECEFRDAIPAAGSAAFRSFAGLTDDGIFQVESVGRGDIRTARYDVSDESHRATVSWRLQGVRLCRHDTPRYARVRYGVTNFEFHGTEPATSFENLELTLNDRHSAVEIVIEPHQQYEAITRFLSLYRSVRVTCEICLDIAGAELTEETDGVVGRLCHILSVARGTRIVWVYRYAYDVENRLADIYHFSAWLGRYAPLSLFDDGPAHMHEVKRFVETAYPIFCERNAAFQLGSNLIESYLAAKAEGDLLERRGVKLAVALEVLRHLFLQQPSGPAKEFIIPERQFDKTTAKALRRAITDALRGQQLDDAVIREMCEKIREFNRTSFAVVLRSLFDAVGFTPSEHESSLFLGERNSLVHTGHFYQYKPEARPLIYFTDEDGSTSIEESESDKNKASFFFMLNFMDRLFLKFFGFSGQYLNRKIHSLKDRHNGNYAELK
jgi:hypothetical protein